MKIAFLFPMVLFVGLSSVYAQEIEIPKELEDKIIAKIETAWDRVYFREASEINVLLLEDSTSLYAWNKKIGYHVMKYEREEAKAAFDRLNELSGDRVELFFLRAQLAEYFKEIELADSLYAGYWNYLVGNLEKADGKEEESRELLSMWYVNMYSGNEEFAKRILEKLYREYNEWITVGIDPQFFSLRFSDKAFKSF